MNVRRTLRVRYYSIRTERAYLHYFIQRFLRFATEAGLGVEAMGTVEVQCAFWKTERWIGEFRPARQTRRSRRCCFSFPIC
jgi:hypothetical protein